MTSTTEKVKHDEIMQVAAHFHAKADWVTFYREVLGLRGVLRRKYPTLEEIASFEQTETFRDIQRMLTDLRKRSGEPSEDEPTRVITVRIPKSMHEALRVEAHEHRTSMNKLCISKLLQYIDSEMVPADGEAVPGS
jgi:predicted HicB family RNase H-like nuclease